MSERIYTELPELVTGYVLNPECGPFSLVVPEATTNLVTNPSLETNTTGWSASGSASIARSAARQRYGAYSLAIAITAATNDGAYYGTVSLTSGTTYTASISVYAPAGTPMRLSFADTSGTTLMTKNFIGSGHWQRISVTYTETATTTRRIYITKASGTKIGTVYVDGLQVEAKSYPTTYCDGDQVGFVVNQLPPPYIWTGTAHASTSTRSAQTRSGGRVVNLDRYGLHVTSHVGLGAPSPLNIMTSRGQLDGAQYQKTIIEERRFSLRGRFNTTSLQQLRRLRALLYADLARDKTNTDQQITLYYQEYDCQEAIGEELRIVAIYQSGLDGTTDNHYGEDVAITFSMPDPFFAGGAGGAALTVQTTVSNANYILQRTPAGVWQALGTGMNLVVQDIAIGLDGALYIGGGFSTANGITVNGITKWDGASFSTLSTGVSGGAVFAVAVAPNGDIYIGGAFTSAGGGGANRIAKWDGSSWSALGSGLDGAVETLAFAPNGDLYAGGQFLNAGGGGANRIAKWDGSSWSALGSGLNGECNVVRIASNSDVYAGGTFTTAGGSSANRIAKWNGSAWSALGSGLNNDCNAIQFDLAGLLYAGGNFTTAGGITATRIASWNGTSWSAVGSGTDAFISDFAIDNANILYIGGNFGTAGGLAQPSLVRWNGTTFIPMDVDPPSAFSSVRAIVTAPDGTVTIGYSASGSATAAGITSVTYDGKARSFPRLTIKGPSSGTSKIYQVFNYTTGKGIYFNYTINAGETAILILNPENISFTSNFQGNILPKILGGSQRSEMYLQPGVNTISFFAESSTVTAVFDWINSYNSADASVY